MSAWQTNLFNNLLVITVLVSIFVIAYCKIKNTTLTELIKSVKAGFSPDE